MNASKTIGLVCGILFLAGHLHAQVRKKGGLTELKDSLAINIDTPHIPDSLVNMDTVFRKYSQLADSVETGMRKNIETKEERMDSIISKATVNLPGQLSGSRAEKEGSLTEIMNVAREEGQKFYPGPISLQKYMDPINIKSNSFSQADPLGGYKQKAESYMDSLDGYKSGFDTLSAIDRDRLDTMLLDFGTGLSENVESRLASMEELEALGETDPFEAFPGELKVEASWLQDVDLQKLEWKKLQKDHFSDHAAVREGMSNMRKMKGRYKEINDSRFLKEGTSKRHSLGDYPFFSRWEWGLHINIRSFAPANGEALLALGYRMNRRWVMGAGPVFNGDIGKGKGPQKEPGSLILSGYRSYTLFTVREGIFLKGEYQGKRSPSHSDLGRNSYHHNVYGGIGTEFKLFGNFRIRSTVLYGINKKQAVRAGSGSRWQTSMGIVNYKK